MGTDFSYDQIDSDLKFDLSDHSFALGDPSARAADDGTLTLLGTVGTSGLEAELGYHGFEAHISAADCAPPRTSS